MFLAMSVPALRKPKSLTTKQIKPKKKKFEQQFLILTLKNGTKLVVSSDAFHGITMMEEMFKCVFCGDDIELNFKLKESHKSLLKHKKFLEKYPHSEEFDENLVRQVNKDLWYCTICNVTTSTQTLVRHVNTEQHNNELNKAKIRATTYKPFDENNY